MLRSDFERFKKLNPYAAKDIESFCEANNHELPTNRWEYLEYFLRWNGIIGYSSKILALIDSLDLLREE